MLRVVFLCFVALGACSKTDIQTGNLVNIRSLGDIPFTLLGKVKATVDTKVDLGGHKMKIAAEVEPDFNDILSHEAFKEVSAAGDYSPHRQVKMGYKLIHKFNNGIQTLKTHISGWGVGAKAEASTSGAAKVTDVTWSILGPYDGIEACGSKFVVDTGLKLKGCGGFTKPPLVTVKTSWWGFGYEMTQPCEPVCPDMVFTSSHDVAPGRTIGSAVTLGPNEGGGMYSVAKLEYTDKEVEPGAAWKMSVSQPLTKLSGTKLDLKRGWSF